MNVMLQILTGPEAGRSIEITPKEPLVLGRAEKGNGLISDPKISSTHCRVSWDGQTIHVEDLDSRNGTYVDGEKVTVAHLELGSMFQLGATEILIKRPQEIGKAPIVKPNVRGPLTELIGEYLSNFEVLEIISRGENSVVFRARDTENKRTVALKVLLPEFVKREEDMKRFVRSVKTMMPVQHPNIVEIYGAGKTGKYCWMAMEFIDGRPLTKVLKEEGIAGTLDAKYALRVGIQIARALEQAHEHQVVHRNLTPRHILVNSTGETFKLVDLVLAKSLEGTMAIQVSADTELVGEVEYMSPEQTQGTVDLDIRSDIYGLGATMYALLAGKPAFTGTGPWQIVTAIRNDAPDFSWRDRLGMSDYFVDAVTKMMAKDPEDRFQDPTELVSVLERVATLAGYQI